MPEIKPEFYHVSLTLSRNDDTFSRWNSNTQIDYNVAIPVEFFNASTLSKVIGEHSKVVDKLWEAQVAKREAEEAEALRRQAEEEAAEED